MSEPRKNRLSIDGGQVAEDEHVASYKQIPETDTEFRTSKNNLTKSKEKVSSDGAEEKLLPKGEEAKIVTRVDMADAKYVVEDHRNGDAKIELDANKRQFTGLSKEELMKYAEDPFWVKIRWFMFVLFWALWLCMLAGAITIIVKAPKCPAPTPRTWAEKGPLVETYDATYEELEAKFLILQTSKIQGIFIEVPTYEYQTPSVMNRFKRFVESAKSYGVKVVVDLIPNYVATSHEWFQKSVKKEAPYTDYFVWRAGRDYIEQVQNPPNNWISTENVSAWTKNEVRGEFYLHQYGINQSDLNFYNDAVVKEFEKALSAWMKAGAAGIRLNKIRQLLVNTTGFPDDSRASGRGSVTDADHTQYAFYSHQQTSDMPTLDLLLAKWSALVAATSDVPDTMFTIAEESGRKLYSLVRNVTSLRPPMTSAITVSDDAKLTAKAINDRLNNWPAIQLVSSGEGETEVTSLAMLLPASPVLSLHQVVSPNNDSAATESLKHLVALRAEASIEHGQAVVTSLPAVNNTNTLLACARWKIGQTGYVAVFNPLEEEQRANLTGLSSVPNKLTVHHMSPAVRDYTNYTSNFSEDADNVLVPPKSSVVLAYVPKTAVEN